MSLQLAERVGSQTPRVMTAPPGDETAGDEAVDLADIAGLRLDEWQRLALVTGMRQSGRRWSASRVGVWVPRQNGKGAIIEARVLAGLFLLREPLIIWSAHRYNTAQEGFLRIRTLIEQTPDLDRQVHRYWTAAGEQGISLRGGPRLRFLARSRTSGRGWGAPCVVWDEAQELTAEQVAAMLPTISAQPDHQVWAFGTPPTDPAAWCYGLREDGEAGRPRLVWLDWGGPESLLEDRQAWTDRQVWAETNPALGTRISPETVEDEHGPSGLGDEFVHERLGVWRLRAGDGSTIVPADLWQSLAAPDADRPGDVAFALVVNRDRTRSAIGWAGRGEDGVMLLGLSDWRAGTAWAVDRLVELRSRWSPVGVSVSTRSEALLLDLEKAGLTVAADPDEPGRGDLAVPSAAEDARAYGLFVDAARGETLRHTDEAPVSTALAQARTRPSAGGVTWDDRVGEVAPLRAVCHALWLWQARAHLVSEDFDPAGQIF